MVARLVRFFEVLARADPGGWLVEAREAAGGEARPM
jgi:hypothetical protein